MDELQPFEETLVVYKPHGYKRWVAHALRINQIGTGDDVIEALADGIRAVDSTVAVAKMGCNLFRDAPRSIQKRAERAEDIQPELYGMAKKMAHGKWLMGLDVFAEVPRSKCFKATYPVKIPA